MTPLLSHLTDLFFDLVRILVTLQLYRSGSLVYLTLYVQTAVLVLAVFLAASLTYALHQKWHNRP